MIERLERRRMFSTYFLNATGNDANDGLSETTPWKSLSPVNALNLQPGDAVLLNGGDTFTGTIFLNASDGGSAAAPVVIDSYGAGRAILNAGNGHGIFAQNAGGISISDLNIVGAGQVPNSFNGIAFDNALPGNAKLDHVYIDNVSVGVGGFGKYGITVGGSNGKSGFNDVRITNADVHHNTLGGIETHGVFSSTATGYANSNVYVGHSVVHDNPGYAGSPNHSGDGIVLSDVDVLTIERNEAYANGAANTHAGGPVGIWVWDVNGAVIQHNESHHNLTNGTADGGGFDFDGGVTNSVMQYNYSHDNAGPGYGIYQFSGARPFHHNAVRYNISANDARKNTYGAIDFWNGNGGNGISNVDVYNNTVYVTPSVVTTTTTTTNKKGVTTTTTTTTNVGNPRALRFVSGTTNVSIRNNIFQTTGGIQLADIQANHMNLRLQGNDWWSSGAAFSLKAFAKSYTSFSAFVTGTGQEKVGTAIVGRNVDPRMVGPFVSPTVGLANIDALESGVGPFMLSPSSTLRDAGVNLFSQFAVDPGLRDFYGNPLPASAFDIGAHEFA